MHTLLWSELQLKLIIHTRVHLPRGFRSGNCELLLICSFRFVLQWNLNLRNFKFIVNKQTEQFYYSSTVHPAEGSLKRIPATEYK